MPSQKGDEGLPGPPGGDHAAGVGAPAALSGLEADVEAIALHAHARHQRRASLEAGRGVAGQVALPAAQLLGQGHGVLAAQGQALARRQLEVRGQLAHEPALGVQVAQGHRAAQGHEAPGVDAGRGRVAVHQGGEHLQGVTLAAGLDADPRLLPGGLGQAPGADVDVDAALQRGQHLPHQLHHRVGQEGAAPGQHLQLAAVEARLAHRMQDVAAERRAVQERLVHGGHRLDPEPEALALVLHAPLEHHRLARAADGPAVEADVGAAGQAGQQPGKDPVRDHPAQAAPEQPLHLHVVGRGREGRALHPSRGHGREGAGQHPGARLGLHHPLQGQAALVPREAVADAAAGGGVGGEEVFSGLLGSTQGDDGGGHVGARIIGAAAVAGPVLVVRREHHPLGEHPLALGHAQDQLTGLAAFALDRVAPGQLHAARPVLAAGRLSHGLEEPLHGRGG